MKPRGDIVIDDGAVAALGRGKSLLPAGVIEIAGQFGRGDPVRIVASGGRQLGIGLTRYTAQETRAIAGRRSGEIAAILGYPGRSALIHRDDFAH